ILVASLASMVSPAIPTVAGVVVSGDYPLSDTLRRLLESAPFPVVETQQPVHVAAGIVQAVRPLIRAESERKIATALGAFDAGVDTAELDRPIALERPVRVAPIMFEYELIARANSSRRQRALLEADAQRVPPGAALLLRRGARAVS